MFKNNEAPVSLFSFQDIITTLTGIMLLFLLVMALIMIQVNSELQKTSPVYGQLQQVRKENEALTADIQRTEEEIAALRKRERELQKRDDAQLKLDKFYLETQLKELKRELDDLKGKLKNLQQKKIVQTKRRQELDRNNRELEQKKKELVTVKDRIEKEKDKSKNLTRKIDEKRRAITITTGGDTNKKPLILECSGNSVRVIPHDRGKMHTFRCETPVIADMLDETIKFVRRFPAGENYYVLLVKPSAASYMNYFLRKLSTAIPKLEYGMEPVLENEEFF